VGRQPEFDCGGMARVLQIALSVVTIEGLTFRHGYAFQTGGAIYARDSVLTISNCTFLDNRVGPGVIDPTQSNAFPGGAAVALQCGVLHSATASTLPCELHLNDSRVEGNVNYGRPEPSAPEQGYVGYGAVSAEVWSIGARITVAQSTFRRNYCARYGAAFIMHLDRPGDRVSVQLSDSVFAEHNSPATVVAVMTGFNATFGTVTQLNVTVLRCNFTGN